MNKRTAHFVLILFDIAAFAGCYFVYHEFTSLKAQIEASAGSITFQNLFGFYALPIVVPLVHLSSFVDWREPARQKIGNVLVVTICMTLVIATFVANSSLKRKIMAAGYYYCEELSEQMTFSKFNTYLKDPEQCGTPSE